MHHQILRWIDPHLDLSYVMENWSEICYGLAEPSRRRIPQIASTFPTK